jgi:integrase
VYKDIKRAAKAFRIKSNISCHTARKIYAVSEYKKDFNVSRVKRLLNHSSEAVTMIYAIADELTARKAKK